jgi:hypothetical protein
MKILTKLTSMSNKIFYLYVSILVTILAGINMAFGPYTSPDTNTYDKLSSILLYSGFNYSELLKNQPIVVILYTFPLTLFAIAKSFFPDNWKFIIILINCFSIIGIILTVIRIAKYSNTKNWLIAVSLFGYILFYDFFVWPHYVLTDTIYSFILIINFWFILKFCNRPIINFSLIKIIIFLLILFFTRPTSTPVILYLVAMLLYYFINRNIIINNQSIKITILFSSIIVIVMAFIVNLNINGLISGEELKLMTGFIKDGVIIHDRPETYILFNNDYISIINVFATRFIYFFSPFSINYSLTHIIVNLIAFITVGLFILIGELMLFKKNYLSSNQFNIVRSLIWGLIITIATFHSITLIDYDWRYRYPLIPLILLLAMLHANNIINQLEQGELKIFTLIKKYFKI